MGYHAYQRVPDTDTGTATATATTRWYYFFTRQSRGQAIQYPHGAICACCVRTTLDTGHTRTRARALSLSPVSDTRDRLRLPARTEASAF